jgi:mono/diheme cytochrome c family protein
MLRYLAGILLLASIALWFARGVGFTSRGTPAAIETTVMRAARRWAIPAAARDRANPAAGSPDVIQGAMEHWADHCAVCHGNDGAGHTSMGHGLYPKPPDLRSQATQGLTDGELFYIIERGVPLTGMPAWGNGTPEGEGASWALVRFIRRLPTLTDREIDAVRALAPASALDREREQQIENFLGGK